MTEEGGSDLSILATATAQSWDQHKQNVIETAQNKESNWINGTQTGVHCWTPADYKLGCHGVNKSTEHRHREKKKNGFTEWTENTTVYKTPLASQYHFV